jgi:HK97 family phage prohead protease
MEYSPPLKAGNRFGTQRTQRSAHHSPYYAYDVATEQARQAELKAWSDEEDRQIEREEAERTWRIPQKGEIEGLACLYGVVCDDGVHFKAGCFQSANPRAVGLYWGHEKEYDTIGVVRCVYEVARKELPAMTQSLYPQATGGLVIVYRLHDNHNGRTAAAWVQSGRIKGLSVGYGPEQTQTPRTKVHEVRRGRLYEVSLALNPAVPGTLVMTGDHRFSLLSGSYARSSGQ